MRPLKLLHEADQGIDACQRHRVVDRRPHSADGTMAFQVRKTSSTGLLQESAVQVEISQYERNVHPRPTVFADGVGIERRIINCAVQSIGLLLVVRRN